MKYIKLYEGMKEPEVGDYVICCEDTHDNVLLAKFISNNIGQIIEIMPQQQFSYYMIYKNFPKSLKSFFDYNERPDCRLMNRTEIIHFSPDKEELEAILTSNKFNI